MVKRRFVLGSKHLRGMMDARLLTFVATVLLVGILTPAEAAKNQKPRATAMVSLDGRCEKLVLPGNDVTSSCSGKVLNMVYSDGRSGFYFVLKDGAVLTFSGKGNVNPDPDTAAQPVDLILFNYKGQTDHTQAVGQCTFGNPYKGPSRLKCQATSADGEFQAEFLSDGKQSHVSQF